MWTEENPVRVRVSLLKRKNMKITVRCENIKISVDEGNIDNYDLNKSNLKKMFVEDLSIGKHFLLAKIDNDIAGLISMTIRNGYEYDGKTGLIMEFVVSKDFRGKGVGKVLLNAIQEFSKEQSCKFIELVCGINRTESHMVYLKNGFKNTALYFNKEIQ